MSGPFRSVEEAYAFIKSHEVATNNKYVVAKSKGISTQDLSSLDSYNIQWEYTSGIKPGTDKVVDGIPFIYFGIELRDCQYGPPRKRQKAPPTEDRTAAENQDIVSRSEEMPQTSGNCPVKRRRTQPSKKLNCPSKLKIKKIMKFPEYAVEVGKEYPGSFKSELGKQLKANFNKDTKRYIQVYVHIDNNHNHGNTPIEVHPKYKKIAHVVDKGCTRISGDSMPKQTSKKVAVLKKWASLKGKNLMDLAMQFKTTDKLPESLARPTPDQKLEDMNDEELLSLYHDITGEMPNNMFSVASKEFTTTNLCLLLHLSMVFANAACDDSTHLQTHHSVRIKGTENNFTPVQCLELDCAIIEAHMHCPLCCKTDCYTDPGLLKSHFKNRHVDKAIEFAGLRILRCYDNCEVTGKNKECKTFKGGHWHCYKCGNGLDKRNSALEHYRSHLKNYESNFQIHVTQDVNPALYGYTVPHEIQVEHTTADSYQASISLNSVSTTAKPSYCSNPLKRSYADTGLDTIDDTGMYVQDDGIGNVTSTYSAQEIPAAGSETYVITVPDNGELTELRNKVRELEMNCKELEKKNTVQKSLIEFLQTKDSNQTKLIAEYKHEKQDLLSQIDTYKSEITSLKSTTQKQSTFVQKDIPSAVKHHRNNSQTTTTGKLTHVPRDVEVSLNKAKELEKRLKNSGKETSVPGHRYGTRRATRKHSTLTSDKDSSGDNTGSKQNVEKHTGSHDETETSENCGTRQIGTMEEMFSQLSSMRREIDLLKQTTLVRSDTSLERAGLQSADTSVTNLHNLTSIGNTVVNTCGSEMHSNTSVQNPIYTSVSHIIHSSLSLLKPVDSFCSTLNAPTNYETSSHILENSNLSSQKIMTANDQLSVGTDSQLSLSDCSSTCCVGPVSSAETRTNTDSHTFAETTGILNNKLLESVRTEITASNTLLSGLSTSSNAGSLDSELSTSTSTVAGTSVLSEAGDNMDNMSAAGKIPGNALQ